MTVPSATSQTRSACDEGEVEVVGRHDDGQAVAGEVGDDQRQLDAPGDVEERRRLVEDEHGRLLGEGAGDEDPLALAVGQLGERPVPQRVDSEAGRRGMGDALVLGVRSPRQPVCGCRPRSTTSPTVSRPGSTRSVSTTATLRARSHAVEAAQSMPSSSTSPASRRLAADERPQQRRLAAAVGSDHRRQLARRGAQRLDFDDGRRPAPVPVAGDEAGAPRAVRHVITSPRPRRVSTQMTTGTPSRAVTALSGSTPCRPGQLGDDVGDERHHGADQRRGGQQHAVVRRGHQGPSEVRRRHADEGDRPGEGGDDPGQHAGDEEDQQAVAADGDAHRLGVALAEQQGVERLRRQQGHGDADDQYGRHHLQLGVGDAAEAAEAPRDELTQAGRIGAGDEQADEGGEQVADHQSDDEDRRRAAHTAGDGEGRRASPPSPRRRRRR